MTPHAPPKQRVRRNTVGRVVRTQRQYTEKNKKKYCQLPVRPCAQVINFVLLEAISVFSQFQKIIKKSEVRQTGPDRVGSKCAITAELLKPATFFVVFGG